MDKDNVHQAAAEIRRLVEQYEAVLLKISEPAPRGKKTPGGWTVREVLGHLIDSATNNHHRLLRLRLAAELSFPDYGPDIDAWISLQQYDRRGWAELLTIWHGLNLHLAQVLETAAPEVYGHRWIRPGSESVSFEEMAVDYVRHMNYHLRQVEELLPKQ
jgi:hypothetical protein